MSASRILDDMAKVAGETMSFVSSARAQVKDGLRNRLDDVADRMDLVPREEFEKLEAMFQETRLKQIELENRLEALEGAKSKPKTTKTKKS